MKKWIISICVVLIMGIVMCFVLHVDECDTNGAELEILLNGDEGIIDFYIEDSKVYIIANVPIKNNTEHNLEYRIIGKSEKDYERGLLKEPTMRGYDESLSDEIFKIGPHETKKYNTVIFVGEHGESTTKADRLIPLISVEIIERKE